MTQHQTTGPTPRDVLARRRCMLRFDRPICHPAFCDECLHEADDIIEDLRRVGMEVRDVRQ